MKKISIITPTFNEEENVEMLCQKIKKIMTKQFSDYDYEHIIIDNASQDDTVNILKKIASHDRNLKVIINSRNFGHIRSPIHALFQATGDAIIMMASDLEDPPEILPLFINKWEEGYNTVLAVKKESNENKLMLKVRNLYYNILGKLSEVQIYKNATGFGLYDKKVINAIKSMEDPYPFFRGMISEVGFKVATVEFNKEIRVRGVTKNNFYTLYDLAMLGIISNSKIPLRIATFMALIVGVLSFFVGVCYLIAKLVYWDSMSLGIAPLVIGGSFAFSILLFFIGIIGEYIGAIYTQVLNRPLVFEQERINFEEKNL